MTTPPLPTDHEQAGPLDVPTIFERFNQARSELREARADLAAVREQLAEAEAKLIFLSNCGLKVTTAKDAGKEPYLAYLVEDGSQFDDTERINKAIEAERDLAAARAEIERLTKQNQILAAKCKGTLANNLCPDHRDKQVGKPCLACEIERLTKENNELVTWQLTSESHASIAATGLQRGSDEGWLTAIRRAAELARLKAGAAPATAAVRCFRGYLDSTVWAIAGDTAIFFGKNGMSDGHDAEGIARQFAGSRCELDFTAALALLADRPAQQARLAAMNDPQPQPSGEAAKG